MRHDPILIIICVLTIIGCLLLALTGCGPSTTDLALSVPSYVSPAASTPTCPSGTMSPAGWCCTTLGTSQFCTPTVDAFADGHRDPIEARAAVEISR